MAVNEFASLTPFQECLEANKPCTTGALQLSFTQPAIGSRDGLFVQMHLTSLGLQLPYPMTQPWAHNGRSVTAGTVDVTVVGARTVVGT